MFSDLIVWVGLLAWVAVAACLFAIDDVDLRGMPRLQRTAWILAMLPAVVALALALIATRGIRKGLEKLNEVLGG